MPLICNAIPKSGTYLLAAIAEFCGYHDTNTRFLDHGTNIVDDQNHLLEFVEDANEDRFFALPDNGYVPCHLTYCEKLSEVFRDSRIKHLFMYRHPADVLFSYVRFVTYSKNFSDHSEATRRTQAQMQRDFDSDEQRFVHVYAQMKHNFNFVENSRWLNEPSTYAIRFEDLYSDILGLQSGEVGPLLRGLLAFVGCTPTQAPGEMYELIHGQGPTFMPTQNKNGQYKALNRDKISYVLDDPEFQKYLGLYGYES